MDLQQKMNNLYENLKSLGSVAVAFSGGVDSSLLLMAAKNALGDNACAVIVKSCLMPKGELDGALEFCRSNDIACFVINEDVLKIKEICENPVNRCYICKKHIFGEIIKIAQRNNIKHIADGSNADDEGDYRPGMKAIAELGIKSPLREAGLCKREIRRLSSEMKLPAAEKPSSACLASRIPYGEEITEEKLKKIEAAELFLHNLGFKQIRVRVHNNLARIEAERDSLQSLVKNSEEICGCLKELGFAYVTMDLQGYRTGSLNETL